MYATVSSSAFKTAMRGFAGAVTVVTTAHGGVRFGLTATAVCSACAEPPTVLVCLNLASATCAAVKESGVFCVNALASNDTELSDLFGSPAAKDALFMQERWTSLETGAPALSGAVVNLDCRVVRSVKHQTHMVFFGEVVRAHSQAERRSLIYSWGAYSGLAALTQ